MFYLCHNIVHCILQPITAMVGTKISGETCGKTSKPSLLSLETSIGLGGFFMPRNFNHYNKSDVCWNRYKLFSFSRYFFFFFLLAFFLFLLELLSVTYVKDNTMNTKYNNYLKSKQWADIKLDLFATRGEKCERCPSTYKVVPHHLTYKNLYNEQPKDLELLCAGCHAFVHGKIKPKYKKKRAKLPIELVRKIRKIKLLKRRKLITPKRCQQLIEKYIRKHKTHNN